uniref:C2H2-type domain-containing protein n=1 Tax=Strigamia maritima TaxID=126957 RepID=T1IY69_STRMM
MSESMLYYTNGPGYDMKVLPEKPKSELKHEIRDQQQNEQDFRVQREYPKSKIQSRLSQKPKNNKRKFPCVNNTLKKPEKEIENVSLGLPKTTRKDIGEIIKTHPRGSRNCVLRSLNKGLSEEEFDASKEVPVKMIIKMDDTVIERANIGLIDMELDNDDNGESSDKISEMCNKEVENLDDDTGEMNDDTNSIGSKFGVGNEKLDGNEETNARFWKKRKLMPNNIRVTVQNGIRLSVKIPSEKVEKFFCDACKVCCTTKKDFEAHKASDTHYSMMGAWEAAHGTKSSRCLSKRKKKIKSRTPGAEMSLDELTQSKQTRCRACQVVIVGCTLDHLKSEEHKKNKIKSQPFCQICDKIFKSPKQYINHVNSEQHKQNQRACNKNMVNLPPERAAKSPEVSEDPFDNVQSNDGATTATVEEGIDMEASTTWTGDVEVGKHLLVSLTGLFCKACKKYYEDMDRASKHCRSKTHFENFKKLMFQMKK